MTIAKKTNMYFSVVHSDNCQKNIGHKHHTLSQYTKMQVWTLVLWMLRMILVKYSKLTQKQCCPNVTCCPPTIPKPSTFLLCILAAVKKTIFHKLHTLRIWEFTPFRRQALFSCASWQLPIVRKYWPQISHFITIHTNVGVEFSFVDVKNNFGEI